MSEQYSATQQALANVAEYMEQTAARLSTVVMLMREQAADVVRKAVQNDPDETFTHTDAYGDGLVVGPLGPHRAHYGVLWAEFASDPEVHLDQDAVNRLAQYLDRHRTDKRSVKIIDNSGSDEEPEQCPWAFLRPKTTGKPYVSYDRCRKVKGHNPDQTHPWHGALGGDLFQDSNPQAFRVDRPGRPNPEPARCEFLGRHGSRCVLTTGHNILHRFVGGLVKEDKPSPAMDDEDPIELCAGHVLGPQGEHTRANATGCDHRRGAHGAFGCMSSGCPCERRNGK